MGDDVGLTRPARALTLATGLTILGSTIVLVAAVPSHDRMLLALGAIGGGTALVAASFTRLGRVSVLSGELTLLSCFLLLATAAPHLRDRSVPTSTVDSTLLATLLGFVSGAEALILSRRAASRPLPQTRWLAATSRGFREGEILIVGTILLAAAATSATGRHLPIPRWNWWSFLGLAAPAMFLIIGARARPRPRNGARSALTVAGLSVMLYGSAANLGAGSNAFRTSPHLTPASLAVCGLGAVLVQLSISRGRWLATGGVSLGLVLMALSERSLATGASMWTWGRGAGLLAAALLAACALPLIATSVWQGSRPRHLAHKRPRTSPHDVPPSNQHRHEPPPRHQLPAGTHRPLRTLAPAAP